MGHGFHRLGISQRVGEDVADPSGKSVGLDLSRAFLEHVPCLTVGAPEDGDGQLRSAEQQLTLGEPLLEAEELCTREPVARYHVELPPQKLDRIRAEFSAPPKMHAPRGGFAQLSQPYSDVEMGCPQLSPIIKI